MRKHRKGRCSVTNSYKRKCFPQVVKYVMGKGYLVIMTCPINVFANTNLGKEVNMVMRGGLVEIIVKVALHLYYQYISRSSKERTILYVCLQKELYGLM